MRLAADLCYKLFDSLLAMKPLLVSSCCQEMLQGSGLIIGKIAYAAYHDTPRGQHQRCWAHLLRDVHGLKVAAPEDPEVVVWARAVKDVYLLAQQWLHEGMKPLPAYREVGLLVHALGGQFAQAKGHPCQALAKRLVRHQDEVFAFVRELGCRLDNNLAERRLRRLVIARKVSGGTRSPADSQAQATLTSMFQTWQARGLNPLHECLQLLQSPPPQI